MKKKILYSVLVGFCILLGIIISVRILATGKESNDKYIANIKGDMNTKGYETYSYITEEMKNNSEKLETIAEFNVEYNPEYLLEESDAIVLASIISVDGASAKYNSVVGMTYGKLLVSETIKGQVKEGEILEYLKPGGLITVSDWESYQDPEANAKREYLRQVNKVNIDKDNTYISLGLPDDIEIEAGKTYLAYLNYSDTYKKYEIIGLGTGLREVNIDKTNIVTYSQNIDNNALKIKNNKTGEYESLNQYIEQYIDK